MRILTVISLLTLVALQSFGKEREVTFLVNSTYFQDACLSVMEKNVDTDWKSLCANIDGFNYEEGFIYTITVLESKLKKKEIIEDGSRYAYALIEVNSKSLDIKEPGIYTKISTSMGDIYGKLDYKLAPLTVANFVGLAEGTIPNSFRKEGEPYFDSLVFHRVIPNFMIQGGDPSGSGSGGPGYKFKNETNAQLKHDKPGVFSMANSGPNTNGSQFFITHKATPWLDGGYNVFGNVIQGQDVVDAIGNVPRNRSDRPENPIFMIRVEIIRVGEDASKFDALKTFNELRQ